MSNTSAKLVDSHTNRGNLLFTDSSRFSSALNRPDAKIAYVQAYQTLSRKASKTWGETTFGKPQTLMWDSQIREELVVKDLGGKYRSYVCTKGIPIVQNFAGLVDSLKTGEVLDFKAENLKTDAQLN